jgi:hypothetical protein
VFNIVKSIHKTRIEDECLMFIPCIIRRSRNNHHYTLICTTPFFYILAPTCFISSLPSSGSFLDPSELLEIQTEWVVYHIICGYVACVPECPARRPHTHTFYDTPSIPWVFHETQQDLRSSLIMAGYC